MSCQQLTQCVMLGCTLIEIIKVIHNYIGFKYKSLIKHTRNKMKISTIVSKVVSVVYMGVLGSAIYFGTPQLLTATLFLTWIWIFSVGISFGVIYLAFKLGKPEDIVKIIEEFKTPSTLLKTFSFFWQAVVIVSLIYLGLVATAVVSFFVYVATWCVVYTFKAAQKQIAELKEQSEQAKPLSDAVVHFIKYYNPDK